MTDNDKRTSLPIIGVNYDCKKIYIWRPRVEKFPSLEFCLTISRNGAKLEGKKEVFDKTRHATATPWLALNSPVVKHSPHHPKV